MAQPPYWKRIVVLFFAGWLLIYANRTVLSPALTVLEQEWRMTNTQLGLLNSAFFICYSLLQLPVGLLADRFSHKALLVPGYFVQALGALGSSLAPGPWLMVAMRALTGLGQSSYYATQFSLSSLTVPAARRALASAVISSGQGAGMAFGFLFCSLLLHYYGTSWRLPFLITGLLTLLAAVAMQLVIRRDSAGRTARSPAAPPRYWTIVGNRNLVLIYLASFCTMYAFFVFLLWLPFYLEAERGLSPLAAGALPSLMPLIALPAAIYAGILSDRLGCRRRVLLAVIPLAAACFAILLFARSLPALAIACIAYGMGGQLVSDPLAVSFVADVAPREAYGAAYGLKNFITTIATFIAPALTGLLSDITGSFNGAFIVVIALLIAAWLCVLLSSEQTNLAPGGDRLPAGEGQ